MKSFSKMQKIATTIAAVVFVLAIIGCGGSAKYKAGTYTATAQGYHGDVTVKMTFSEKKITNVSIDANETQGIGSRAVEDLPKVIIEKQSADIDGITGASVSSNAIKRAAQECIDQAIGASSSAVKMAPGTYTTYSESFQARDGLRVTVKLSETKIESITVDKDNTADTPTVLQSAIDKLIPRIIDSQSLSVDAITGATSSSNAIKNATALAIQEAIVKAGGNANQISAFYKPSAKAGGTQTMSADVLIIGMGGSGTMAALSAAESGLKVLAIDKAGKYGGTTALTTEGLFVNPPRFQKEHNGGKDYTDANIMLRDWLTYTEGDAKEEIVRRVIFESGKVLDWLVYDEGIEFSEPGTGFTPTDVYVTKYQWMPNNTGANKDAIGRNFDKIYSKFEKLGGTYMLETEAYELIFDEATNTVKGAKARNKVTGTEYTLNAKAVVIATGGYAGSEKLMNTLLHNDYYPIRGYWRQYGSLQNDGKMLEAALDIGAATYNISMPPEVHLSGTESWLSTQFDGHELPGQFGMMTGRQSVWAEGDLPANLGWSSDSLAVDKNGKRFTSETGVAMLDPWIAGPNYYSIWSQEQLDKIAKEGFDTNRDNPSAWFLGAGSAIPPNVPLPKTAEILAAAEKAGIVTKANTIAELATKMNMPNLAATVDTYNSYCTAKRDTQFNKPAEFLDKIGSGPYYCITMASYTYGSCGGLDINERFEVLNTNGRVIEGLYAVGTDAMGVLFTEKKPYVTYGGANNGWGMVSGYLCGKELEKKYK